jgi:sulfotransferase
MALHAVADLPQEVQARLYYVRFEDLMDRPAECMRHLFGWLGVSPFEIDLQQLRAGARESDSHYHMKYLHTRQDHLAPPRVHIVPPRIQSLIQTSYSWYFQMFYPKKLHGE